MNFLSFYHLVAGYDMDKLIDLYDITETASLPEPSIAYMKALFCIHPEAEFRDIELNIENEDHHLFYNFDPLRIFCFPPKLDTQTNEEYEMAT